MKAARKLTAEHIRYATPTQIGKLINKNPNTVSRWNRRGFKTSAVQIAYACIDLETLVTGLIRRREDFREVEKLQIEFDEILNNSQKLQDPAVA